MSTIITQKAEENKLISERIKGFMKPDFYTKKDCFPTLLRVVAVFFYCAFFYSAFCFATKRLLHPIRDSQYPEFQICICYQAL